jgi:hypothetical protein
MTYNTKKHGAAWYITKKTAAGVVICYELGKYKRPEWATCNAALYNRQVAAA